jgi:Lon protease-like protein
MSDLLPLFPLPSVVLFPNVFLPLHIFEARYREMVADALAGDRLIGMVLLKPGWERDYEGRPAVFPVGCSGVITHAEYLADGRYNLVLRGVERFRIVSEDHERRYRRAIVEPISARALAPAEWPILREYRAKLDALIAPLVARKHDLGRLQTTGTPHEGDPFGTRAMSDEDLVNALAQYLDLEPIEKQALLEEDCLAGRAAALVELIEMKMLMARTPGLSNVAH